MPIFFDAIFLISLAAMVVVYPMYFMQLSAFGKIMLRDHPDLLDGRGKDSTAIYALLNKVKDGQLDGVALSPEALLAYSSAKRLLYLGLILFLVVLLIGLTDASLSKRG
ncbi:hypothetical protein [Pseudoxanthomonas winnipegensis]|uniref:Uncharacterized protein n=1 Tax=Pseudoxanthomonas winnipegensis TaxID=2480810 RepID=A0A4Q8M2H2_9GAMM|nr:hypothetical protein [Pseudoxanthomonas winnipegensis]TAA40128.1 hypothetical protein EA655_13295 [Pseudoxanthomonas winnipegensis]